MKKKPAIEQLREVVARLRSPGGCPWDREQTHRSIRMHAVEEVYELVDAIEAADDPEMLEELGDVLLQVVFHAQLAQERGAFDFDQVARRVAEKLIRRHPHVFGTSKAKSVAAVWAQWERIKRAEKEGTRYARPSVFDGIPKHLPALMRAEELSKKARKAGLKNGSKAPEPGRTLTRTALGRELFALAQYAQQRGWSSEALLRAESKKVERTWRRQETAKKPAQRSTERPAAAKKNRKADGRSFEPRRNANRRE